MRPSDMDDEFMGMADYASESIYDLLRIDFESLSETHSSDGSHHPSRECFMAKIHDHHTSSTDDTEGHPRGVPAHVPAEGRWPRIHRLQRPPHHPCKGDYGWNSCRPDSGSSTRRAMRWNGSAPNSNKKSSAIAPNKGAHEPGPATYNGRSWKTTMVSHDSPEPTKTLPLQWLYSVASQHPLPPKSARPNEISTSCSDARQSSRQRTRNHDDTGMTPVSALPPGATRVMRRSTRHHKVQGSPTCPRFRNASAPFATPESS